MAPIIIDGIEWPTTEHYYQAQKCENLEDSEKIRRAEGPGQAKQMVRNFKPKESWEGTRYGVMVRALTAKFQQHQDLRAALLNTGETILIEGNMWHDNYWGVCICQTGKCMGFGENKLGEALMFVRSELKK